MQHTALTVTALASSVDAAPSYLLTSSNPKTAKGEGYGYLTGILHLAPHKASGVNVCPSATKGCIAACLNTAGRGGFDSTIQRARIRRTKWFKQDRNGFMLRLERDIVAHVRKAERNGLKPAVRLNGTSDLPWENLVATWRDGSRSTVFARFPGVQFYDYTKVAARFSKPLPSNYDLTFSLAESNREDADRVLAAGGRVAVVMRNVDRPTAQARRWSLPSSWDGRTVVDADRHDLRFLDPGAVWCGLKAKGLATRDRSGFVHDVRPSGDSYRR